MSDTSKNRHRMISIEVGSVDIDWVNIHDCTVENGSIKSIVMAKASQLENVIKLTGLLQAFEVRFRFVETNALIEVFTFNSSDDLFGFENKLETIREELRRRFVNKRDAISENINIGHGIHPIDSTGAISNHAEDEALTKFLSGSSLKKMEIDFLGSGKEVVELKKIIPIATKILDENALMEVSGEVRQFDDEHEKLTLFKVQGMRSQIVLTVNNSVHRKLLLSAQSDRRIVKIQFVPERDTNRPNDLPTAGQLTNVEITGWAQDEML